MDMGRKTGTWYLIRIMRNRAIKICENIAVGCNKMGLLLHLTVLQIQIKLIWQSAW